jgi:hypothetical protein
VVALPVDREGIDRVVAAIARDLVATLGWSQSSAERFVRDHGGVDHFAEALREFGLLSLANSVLGNVQVAIHGQGDGHDNQWPRCPLHGTHPLFPDDDLVWRCPSVDDEDPRGFVGGIPFGWLDAVWPANG